MSMGIPSRWIVSHHNLLKVDESLAAQKSIQPPLEKCSTKCCTIQAFRFMAGPGHCPIISKYGPSLSKTVGPVDPSFFVVKISHFYKNIHLTVSLRTPQNRKYI